jgi:hypothetical protein
MTSTKCQYQAEHSNPTVCSGEFFFFLIRINDVSRNVDPINTWIPWNPVAIKNVDPMVESDIENGASLYSIHWSVEKSNPRVIVIANLLSLIFFLFFIIAWWAQVMVAPEDNKMIVFNSGILNGLNGVIINGGHLFPISVVGEILEWKNDQKNARKNMISDVINVIIPTFKPSFTIGLCSPFFVDSRSMSRHQLVATIKIGIVDKVIRILFLLFIHITIEKVKYIALVEAKIGHGLSFTK